MYMRLAKNVIRDIACHFNGTEVTHCCVFDVLQGES